jgi:hypothetical protein
LPATIPHHKLFIWAATRVLTIKSPKKNWPSNLCFWRNIHATYIGQQVMSNVIVIADALDAIKPAISELFGKHKASVKRYFKAQLGMQSLTLLAVLMNGNGPWSRVFAEEIPVTDRYCRSNQQSYPVGALIKRANGTYTECFQDRPGAQPYWGAESRPRSRSSRLT